MPKEKVDSVDGSGFTVQVGWSGNTVQVATEVSDQTSIVRQLYDDRDKLIKIGRRAVESGLLALHNVPEAEYEEAMIRDGRRILELVEGPVSELSGYREDEYRGLWATLDRHGVNRMIRTLRKARDHAFGRDE